MGCGYVCRAEGAAHLLSLPLLLLLLVLRLLTQCLPAVISGLGSHQAAQQLWLPAASAAAPTGDKAARGAGREAAPISASSHVADFKVPLRQAFSQDYIHTETLVCTHSG